ncbi:hypothetical protein [Saccharopolyspora rosea]|uniref:DUF3040 domain-containing protein n=1 Tax=Saccharopolyspora rosea TaxID=524884 RepID=A0ABW3FQD0_9PSEU|nr:hypothetical protein [Saccharopolyspora rosea]
MQDEAFRAELRRRLDLIDRPDEGPLPDLPWRDVWCAAVALAVLSAALLWWGYPG